MAATYDDNSMPTNYDSNPNYIASAAAAGGGGSSLPGVLDHDYARSLPGIFKAVEILLSTITFICACVWVSILAYGSGWVLFVSLVSILCAGVFYVLYLFNYFSQLPPTLPMKFIEFTFYVTMALFWLISGIVAACAGWRTPSAGAASFFAFACMFMYGADSYFRFVAWRSSGEGPMIGGMGGSGGGGVPPPVTPSPGAGPTPTVTTVEKGPQY